MSALGKVVRSGVGRRKVQTLVTGLAATMAVTASVLGGSLLVASTAPFDRAFADQHGAHLAVQFDAGRASSAQLLASTHAAGVTATAGPFPTAVITPRGGAAVGPDSGANADGRGTDVSSGGGNGNVNGGGDVPGNLANSEMPPMTVVGRADPHGSVDDVTLTEGTWATGPGQIVLSAGYNGPLTRPGTTLLFPDLPGSPKLTVVGVARSVSGTADGWVAPSEIGALTAPGAVGGYQMLYRFAAADTTSQIAADRAAIAAAAPAGALTGVQSWLNVKQGADRNTALFVPFLIAFGLLGVVMSVLIVGNVVTGAVGAASRRIGILKAIGFTPAQVVRAYMGQALIPAAVGTTIGVVAGNLLAIPVLSATNQLYGTNTSGVAPWVDIVVITGALGLAAVTAWAAALRAGRLRTVDALAVGRTPRPGRGRRAAWITARLPLPRAVGLGLARPFAHPGRTASMVAAIVFGAAAVTFAVGMGASLGQVQAAKNHDTADVVISSSFGPRSAPDARNPITADPAGVTSAIGAQGGTRAYYGSAVTEVSVAGVTGSTTVFAFTGDSSWAGYRMVSGSWFHGAGEAVVPTTFLTATGARIGDTVTLIDHGTAVPVRLVGEILDPHTQTMEVLTDAATLAVAEPNLPATSYYIAVKHGTDVTGYLSTLNDALRPLGITADIDQSSHRSGTIIALDSLTAILTLMLVVTAALGVLNAVVLDTRERVHDIGVHKALGMTPRQTIVMVVASVLVIGLVGGAVGVPIGVALQAVTVPAMGHSAGITMPGSVVDVYHPGELLLLGLGGPLIAIVGALLPAGWAARTRTATALRTE